MRGCGVGSGGHSAQSRALLLIGLDVGSTTVKAVVVDPANDALLWSDYARHNTRPYETCLDFLTRIERAFSDRACGTDAALLFRVFMTGAGGAAVGAHICGDVDGCFVQEVNAVCLTVEKRHPDTGSVIELGGEDAKIIVFHRDPETDLKTRSASMNDKCAGGTGAVIDKISVKLGVSFEQLDRMSYHGMCVHPVAGKCGVFAETDLIGLQKQGVPPEELMASLFDAIVQHNLALLARGNTLPPRVLLLGGPHVFIPGMRECWRHHLPRLWRQRRTPFPADEPLEDLIRVPEHALLFAALGAVEFGKGELKDNPLLGRYRGTGALRRYIEVGRFDRRSIAAGSAEKQGRALVESPAELEAFKQNYAPPRWTPKRYACGAVIEAFLGIDGGSTTTKAVLLGPDKNVIAKAYQLSQGNPIEDAKQVVAALHRQLEDQDCTLRILGVATTGYAKDILKGAVGADLALVETVAHMKSGLHEYPHADVICDVGGQDIKIILLKDGVVKDFRLNTQCSAGNGYYLQAMASAFDYRIEEYAEAAFSASAMPQFGYGCAVFMQSEIVDFQRQGWQPNEILAGLAVVLPKNIWLYVCQLPNLMRAGKTYVLQGGVQRNLAAVKAQVNFIRERFEGSGVVPEIIVHRHCGESGAIGCALEAHRRYREHPYATTFIGFEALQALQYTSRRDESTRCRHCTNRCMRTFIDLQFTNGKKTSAPSQRRVIVANCERGGLESAEEMQRGPSPNLVSSAARAVFEPVDVEPVADAWSPRHRFAFPSRRRTLAADRARVRIGIPRVMNLYATAPFFLGFFQSLGVPPDRVVWSDYTSRRLYAEGASRASIDPCFPSKLAIAHVHDLLTRKHAELPPLTHVFFPAIDGFPKWLHGVIASRGCPASVAAVEATYAAFVKETDAFAEQGIRFKRTFLDLSKAGLCARQMYDDWKDELGLTEDESRRAVDQGLAALERYHAKRRREARAVLDMLEREHRVGIVLLARPYHHDPGINHGICDALQRRGYPILTHDSLPLDDASLRSLYGRNAASALRIDDVWKHGFSEHSSRKLWAAKFVARHPNLVALELSNFKCGLDAPIAHVLEAIIERSGVPLFYFRDIDENTPAASIRLRLDTMAYFLERHQERIRNAAEHGPCPGTFSLSPEDQVIRTSVRV